MLRDIIRLSNGKVLDCHKIEITKNVINIYDKNNDLVYYEDSRGFWIKREFDENRNEVYYEDSNDFWVKREFHENGTLLYYENSDGLIKDNREVKKSHS